MPHDSPSRHLHTAIAALEAAIVAAQHATVEAAEQVAARLRLKELHEAQAKAAAAWSNAPHGSASSGHSWRL